MNKQTFKGILIGVMLMLVLPMALPSFAQSTATSEMIKIYHTIKSVTVDGHKAKLSEEPFIHEGRTYVPLRAITENLDCDIHWDGPTSSIQIFKDTVAPAWTPIPTVKPTPAPTVPQSEYVYITKTGTKYHKAGCSYLKDSCIRVKLSDVKGKYTPCSRCYK